MRSMPQNKYEVNKEYNEHLLKMEKLRKCTVSESTHALIDHYVNQLQISLENTPKNVQDHRGYNNEP